MRTRGAQTQYVAQSELEMVESTEGIRSDEGIYLLTDGAKERVNARMKKLNWMGLIVTAVVALGAMPACAGEGTGDGDGETGGTTGETGGATGDTGGASGDTGGAAASGGSATGGGTATGGTDAGTGGDAAGTGGDGTGGAAGDPDCTAYCDKWFSLNCDTSAPIMGTGNVYGNHAACMVACEGFTTDVTVCRKTHIDLAESAGVDPHCGHAAKVPTDQCAE